MTLPARALRTGTAVLPWPGSNAIATPAPPVTDPAWVSAAASRDGRDCRAVGSATPSGPCAWRADRPPRGRCEHGEGKQRDDGEPGAEDGEVNLDAGVRFC